MYTDEELETLEQNEYDLTEEEFLALLLLFNGLQENLVRIISTFYQRYGKDGVVTYQNARKWVSSEDHRKRLYALMFEVTESFADFHEDLERDFKDHLKDIVKMETDFFEVDIEDIEKLLETRWGLDELSWSDRLNNNCSKWNAVINNELKKAMLQKKSISEVLDDMSDKFNSMEKAMWNLYQTESSAINSITRKDLFKQMGAKEYRYYTRVDERRCETCGEMHGKVFPISAFEVGVTASPMHSHCRCWEVPILD